MFEKVTGRPARRIRDEQGASAVEYGLLVALIAAIVVLAVFAMGTLVRNTFSDTCTSIEQNGNSTSDNGCG